MIDIQKFIRSLTYALAGLKEIFLRENNFKIEMIIAVLVFGIILYFPLTVFESIALVVLMGLVLVFEVINTAVERLVSLHRVYHPEHDKDVGFIKDIMAGAVLILALTLVSVAGIVVFNYI